MSPFQGSNHLWGFLTQRCAPSGRLRWASIVAHIRALAAPRPRLKPSDALQRLGRVGLMRNMWGSRRCLIGRRCPITPSALYNNTLKSASARDNNSPMRAPCKGAKHWEWRKPRHFLLPQFLMSNSALYCLHGIHAGPASLNPRLPTLPHNSCHIHLRGLFVYLHCLLIYNIL